MKNGNIARVETNGRIRIMAENGNKLEGRRMEESGSIPRDDN